MGTGSPLGAEKIMAFVATEDAAKAKAFYRDTLGLRLMSEDHFALAFDAHGIMLRVTNVGKAVIAPYTVLGWAVKNIYRNREGLAEGWREIRALRGPGPEQTRRMACARRGEGGMVQGPGRQHPQRHRALKRTLTFAFAL